MAKKPTKRISAWGNPFQLAPLSGGSGQPKGASGSFSMPSLGLMGSSQAPQPRQRRYARQQRRIQQQPQGLGLLGGLGSGQGLGLMGGFSQPQARPQAPQPRQLPQQRPAPVKQQPQGPSQLDRFMKGAGETAGKAGSFIAKEAGEAERFAERKFAKHKYVVRSEDEEMGGYETQVELRGEFNEGDVVKLPGEDKTSVVIKKGW